MEIVQATAAQFEAVKAITIQTILQIYPHYYPKGAVDFFLAHHSDARILADIDADRVYLLQNDSGVAVGTVTLTGNDICRLFVLPQYQKNGFGRALMDFAESEIAKHHPTCMLHASLPAKAIYQKRGYRTTEFHCMEVAGGDFLCYDIMCRDCGDAGGQGLGTDTAQTFAEAVQTGREIEFSCNGQHYFESRHSDTDWYIYHEETKQTQHFSSGEDLLQNTVLQGRNIHELWSQITLDCIL